MRRSCSHCSAGSTGELGAGIAAISGLTWCSCQRRRFASIASPRLRSLLESCELASIDAPAVEGDAILLRESLHLCFGGADMVEVKWQRAHDDQHLVGLRRILLVAGSTHFGT